jgi:hypothetical protein
MSMLMGGLGGFPAKTRRYLAEALGAYDYSRQLYYQWGGGTSDC